MVCVCVSIARGIGLRSRVLTCVADTPRRRNGSGRSERFVDADQRAPLAWPHSAAWEADSTAGLILAGMEAETAQPRGRRGDIPPLGNHGRAAAMRTYPETNALMSRPIAEVSRSPAGSVPDLPGLACFVGYDVSRIRPYCATTVTRFNPFAGFSEMRCSTPHKNETKSRRLRRDPDGTQAHVDIPPTRALLSTALAALHYTVTPAGSPPVVYCLSPLLWRVLDQINGIRPPGNGTIAFLPLKPCCRQLQGPPGLWENASGRWQRLTPPAQGWIPVHLRRFARTAPWGSAPPMKRCGRP